MNAEAFEVMVQETLKKGVPEPGFYRDYDLETDRELMASYGKKGVTSFIWGIRTNGTHLFPLGAGFNAKSAEPSLARCIWLYQVTPGHAQVLKLITLDGAMALLRKPINISPVPAEANSQMELLLAMGHWGLFEPPSIPNNREHWPDWKRYFVASGNKVMEYAVADALSACP